MSKKNEKGIGIYQALFGQEDIPISTQVDFTPGAERTILIGTTILVTGTIIAIAIIKNTRRRSPRR